MPKLSLRTNLAIHAAADDSKPGTIEMEAYNGGLLQLRYWDHPVVCDIRGLRAAADIIPIRIAHGYDDISDVLGQGTVAIDGNAVKCSGIVTGVSERAQQVIAMARKGHKFQASIGGDPKRQEFIAEGTTITMNGREFSGPLYAVYETEISEVSVVALGADTTTSVSIAASAARGVPTMDPKFVAWLEAKGFSAAELTEKQKGTLKAAYDDEETKKEAEAEGETEEEEKKEKEKTEAARKQASLQAAHGEAMSDPMVVRAQAYARIAAIEATCRNYPDICAKALEGKWSDDKIQLEILRASRATNQAPAGHVHGAQQPADQARALEATCLMAGGISGDRLVKQYGEQTIEAAYKLRGIGIRDMFRIAAGWNGVQLPLHTGSGEEFTREALRATFSSPYDAPGIQAAGGFSTLSLPGILSNVAHKLLLEGYNYVDPAWRTIAKMGVLQDFKPHNRFRLTDDMKFQRLRTGGELQPGKLGEQAYQITGDTFGILFNLDRKLIVNDDLSAFSEIPRKLGRGCGLAIADAVWTLWLSNPTTTTAYGGTASYNFFSTDNSNYMSGTTVGTNDSRLNVEGLARAYTQQLKQTDPAGYPLGVEPSLLLVPASLRYAAESLMLSRVLVSSVSTGATNNNLQPSENPLAGKFQVVASPYLDNANYTGYSATAWYLMVDPNVLHAIEVAFLNGMQQPTVERAEADFNTLGVRFRGWVDFGVALGEHRAAIKSAGA